MIYMKSDSEIGVAGNINDALLDVKAMAKKFNVCTRSVWRFVAGGLLPPPVRIGRCCRWFEADVLAVKKRLLEQREREAKRNGKCI
jgi:predicted DNA-binding transcriptional regulator AlpA